jgi:hypothetical protein
MRLDSYELDGLDDWDNDGVAVRSGGHDSGAREISFGGYASAGSSGYGAGDAGREGMLFAGASGSAGETAGTDELDIPAFLRRASR